MKAEETIEIYGARDLSNREIISLIVGQEVVGVLYDLYGSLTNLAKCTVSELKRVKGIGPRKAQVLVASFDLARRVGVPEVQPIRGSATAYKMLAPHLILRDQEIFVVVALNAKHKVLAIREVARGSVSSVEVHPREVFSVCVRETASACIVSHNHPSGDPEPSQADINLTKRLSQAGDLLGISLLDHIVVSNEKYVSLADRRLM